MTENLSKAAQAIHQSNCIIITAGAGMGVDSGLPDFRGKEGFWKAYPPMKELGIDLQSTSNPKWFKEDPEFAWGFWSHRCNLYSSSWPHEGYFILERLTREKKYGHFVFTSNVDGHFERVFEKNKIMECHGSTKFWQCSDPNCSQKIFIAPLKKKFEYDEKTFRAKKPLPKCETCDGVARPNVLMFGDEDYKEDRYLKQRDNYHSFFSSFLDEKDQKVVIIEVGAGTYVPSVRNESEKLKRVLEGTLIRINPTDSGISFILLN
jgi:NAD-dependent SIR2 family protein deacetylase